MTALYFFIGAVIWIGSAYVMVKATAQENAGELKPETLTCDQRSTVFFASACVGFAWLPFLLFVVYESVDRAHIASQLMEGGELVMRKFGAIGHKIRTRGYE